MADGKIPKSLRKKVLSEEGAECSQCGVDESELKTGSFIGIDHIIPPSKGGTNERSNLRVLCTGCNSKKGQKIEITKDWSMWDFFVATYYLESDRLTKRNIGAYTAIFNKEWKGFIGYNVRAKSGVEAKKIAIEKRLAFEIDKRKQGNQWTGQTSDMSGSTSETPRHG
jgi:hypothetical protein